MDQHCVQLVHLLAGRVESPFAELHFLGIGAVIEDLLIGLCVRIELEALELQHQNRRQIRQPQTYIITNLTFLCLLHAVDVSPIRVFPFQGLFSDVVIQGSREGVGERQLQVVEALPILSPKVSLSKYSTHVAALDVMHQLSAEQIRHASPLPTPVLDSPL